MVLSVFYIFMQIKDQKLKLHRDDYLEVIDLTEEQDQELEKAYESGFVKKPEGVSTERFLNEVVKDPTSA